MMSNTMKVISECFVKPKHEVEASKQLIYLNPIELFMLCLHPIQKGLLYTFNNQPNNNNNNISSSSLINDLLHKLQISLSTVLVHFYPLAGRFVTETFVDEHACAVLIDCNKGPGAKLTHVVAPNVTVADIVTPVHLPAIVRKFFDLGEEFINYDCQTRPLLSVQVTELVDGVFLGFTMNHSAVDGTSFMHFLSMLSKVFCSNNIITSESLLEFSEIPVYEHRSPIKLPYLGLEEIMNFHETCPLKDRVFHFSSNSLRLLKEKTNKEFSVQNISSFQSLVSLIWRSITSARNLPADQETSCCLIINARPRLDPPLVDHNFGCDVSGAKAICKVGDLLGHNLGWAANRLNDSVKATDDKVIRGAWAWAVDAICSPDFDRLRKEYHMPNEIVFGGSSRFDLYGVEFGLGKPVAVRNGFGYKSNGKVTASQGSESGSVDLEISLVEEHMAALEADHDFMSFVS